MQTQGSQNTAGYSNPEVDRWLVEARSTQDITRHRERYAKVIAQVHDDAPIIDLYRTKNQLGVNDKVGSVRMFSDYIVRLDTAGFVE